MRKTIVLTLLSAASASGMSKLDALSMIESADNDSAVGQAGEVSRFQIKPHIWRQYSPNPGYGNSALARVVARRFLADLEADFRRRARREPNDFDRYVLWNAGAAYYARVGYSRARVNRVVRERADRFANLCQSLSKEAPAPAAIQQTVAASSPSRTNAAPTVTFSLELKPAQLEFPAFALQPDLPPAATLSPRASERAAPTPPRGMVAASILEGR
jgi:hypothetical protein